MSMFIESSQIKDIHLMWKKPKKIKINIFTIDFNYIYSKWV
jgi:hypothetical protein